MNKHPTRMFVHLEIPERRETNVYCNCLLVKMFNDTASMLAYLFHLKSDKLPLIMHTAINPHEST